MMCTAMGECSNIMCTTNNVHKMLCYSCTCVGYEAEADFLPIVSFWFVFHQFCLSRCHGTWSLPTTSPTPVIW